MKRLLAAALAVAGAMSLPATANAADFITITGPSGIFGDDAVMCGVAAGPCSFSRTFEFLTPVGFNLTNVTISSIATTNMMTDIDFSSVTLNGVNFNTLLTGTQEFRNLFNQALIPGGNNVINVLGTTGGDAAFSGNLSFAATSAVPEPGTWLMMLIGFGAIGYSMRSSKAARMRLPAFAA